MGKEKETVQTTKSFFAKLLRDYYKICFVVTKNLVSLFVRVSFIFGSFHFFSLPLKPFGFYKQIKKSEKKY